MSDNKKYSSSLNKKNEEQQHKHRRQRKTKKCVTSSCRNKYSRYHSCLDSSKTMLKRARHDKYKLLGSGLVYGS